VEGDEAQVLKGAMYTLSSHRPVVLCDYNSSQTLDEVASMLQPQGYVVQTGPPITAVCADD